jgi:hypothetical protein
LPLEVEKELVVWVKDFQKEGVPISTTIDADIGEVDSDDDIEVNEADDE